MCDIQEEGQCSHEDSKSLSNGRKDEAGSDEINTLLSEEHGDEVIIEDTNRYLNDGQNDEVFSAKTNASLVSNEQEHDDVCTKTNTFVSNLEQKDDDLYTESNTFLSSDQKGGEGVEETNILLDVKSTKYQTKPSKIGFCERLKKDKVFQRRIIHTFVVYWSFITMGWATGMAGPAFPDLSQIAKVDLASASWLFSVGGAGYMVGSLLFGVLYDRYNRHIMLAMCTFGFAVFNGVKPFCSVFPVMVAVQLLNYIFSGGLDTGANADIPFVWGTESGPYLQAVHLSFCVGAILAPLATEPFLAKKICVFHSNNTGSNITTYSTILEGYTDNVTILEPQCQEEYEETRVQYAFLISTVMSLSASIGCVFLYFKLSDVYVNAANAKRPRDSSKETDTSGECVKPKGHHMSRRLKAIFLCLLAILLMTYCIIEDEFGNFLMTFVITYLNWNKESGSYVNTVYWACFVIGRFAGIFLVKQFKQSRILTVFLLSIAFSLVGFWLAALYSVTLLIWIFSGAVGMSMSVIVASIFSWTSENVVKITGKISAFLCVSASTGVMFFPILAGYLMEVYTPMWLVYILIIVSIINLMLYTIIRILTRIYILNSGQVKETEHENA